MLHKCMALHWQPTVVLVGGGGGGGRRGRSRGRGGRRRQRCLYSSGLSSESRQ